MANAPVLKTGVRKDLGVRIPRPPLDLQPRLGGALLWMEGVWKFHQQRVGPTSASPAPTRSSSAITVAINTVHFSRTSRTGMPLVGLEARPGRPLTTSRERATQCSKHATR